ncbi:MAG: Smr/MutS family protein [Polyangiaceae bacterium]|nr:Smr/MutS family protein [Polyangiaceae bacterium]
MGTKPRTQRTETKKKKANPTSADSPFFRPFAALAAKKARSEKAPTKVPEKPPASPPEEASMVGTTEAETFAIFMAGVRSLDGQRATRVPVSSEKIEPRKIVPATDPDADARTALQMLVADGARFEVVDDGERIEGRRIDVDPREVRRLRRGAYTVDGRLDLHGMTAGEARRQVESFVRKRRSDGDRVIALIVGRGNHSPRGIGVLRGEIAAWLSQGPVAHHIAAFASAPEDEGGPGVVLALLAR